MTTARSRALVAIVLALGLVSGCTPAPQTHEPSADPSASHAPSPSSTPDKDPSTPAVDPADPSTWLISEGGVGPIRIGEDFDETLDALPETWENDTANCGWTAWWNAEDGSYGMYFVRGTQPDDQTIREIAVYRTADEPPAGKEAPRTERGLSLQSRGEDVQAAYDYVVEGDATIGGGTWQKVMTPKPAHIFFQFREDSIFTSQITVTTADEPSYEVCG